MTKYRQKANAALPEQCTPSPEYPWRQVQINEPNVLLHCAFTSQLCVPLWHSSISSSETPANKIFIDTINFQFLEGRKHLEEKIVHFLFTLRLDNRKEFKQGPFSILSGGLPSKSPIPQLPPPPPLPPFPLMYWLLIQWNPAKRLKALTFHIQFLIEKFSLPGYLCHIQLVKYKPFQYAYMLKKMPLLLYFRCCSISRCPVHYCLKKNKYSIYTWRQYLTDIRIIPLSLICGHAKSPV